MRGLETGKKVLTLTWNVMLMNLYGARPDAAHSESAGKKLSSISLQKRDFPNPRPTQLKLSDSFFLLLSLSEVAEVPGLPFGTSCLGSPTSKGFCPNIRSFFSSKRHTDLSTMQAKYYLAEQEIPRWSGGILKGWSDFLQNTSLAPMETEVCYL